MHKTVSGLLIVLWGYAAIRIVMRFIEMWESMSNQGIGTTHLVLTAVIGGWLLWLCIPICFIGLFFIGQEDDTVPLIGKGIAGWAIAFFVPPQIILLWSLFVNITYQAIG